jgi:protein-S-isoprenylcysteine O-methyltransferase Ste14
MSINTKLKLLLPLLYFSVAMFYFFVSWPENFKANHVVGVSIAGVSFALWITARVQLGNAFSLAPKATYLVKNGLYSKLQHPVYYFSIIALIGVGIYANDLYFATLVVVLIIVEAVRIRNEENTLLDAFGDEYVKYKSTTWM